MCGSYTCYMPKKCYILSAKNCTLFTFLCENCYFPYYQANMDVNDESFEDFFPKLIYLNETHSRSSCIEFETPSCIHCKKSMYEKIDSQECVICKD